MKERNTPKIFDDRELPNNNISKEKLLSIDAKYASEVEKLKSKLSKEVELSLTKNGEHIDIK
ncbi:hypothetical protein JKA74_01200 [Marivirga sp. S37H4]|uniref:Uncharacterized protein n=1 Tax=Marivirga aurantiaca TaxID=2802615 RepID=A0A935C554_9BACT|nr:hypothetical protein [Marivirga aurantiaca]MBK6263634.1 hypothetical protein [Marivirga aurantiaca]